MNQLLSGIFSLLMLLFVLCFPEQAIAGASNGLLIWSQQLVPALLPCMILTQLLLASGLLDRLGRRSASPGKLTGLSGNGLYILILGLLCGCPMGAKLTADFCRTNRLSRQEALRLLCISSQLSPAFLMDFAAYRCFSEPYLQKWLLISYYMSLCLYLLVVRFFFCRPQTITENLTQKEASKQSLRAERTLDTSIANSLRTTLYLGGYVILFSVVAGGFRYLSPLPSKADSIILGLIEITTGLEQLYDHVLPPLCKAILSNSLCAFGGICGLLQVNSVITDSFLPLSTYIAAKLAQTIFTAVCTAVLFLFFVL